MKNLLTIISLALLMACGDGNEQTVEALIEANDTDGLKKRKSELLEQEKEINAEIKKINIELDKEAGVKTLPLVSIYEIEDQEFNHYVELQGSVETNQNIVVYPEIQGTLLDFKVNMGDRVSKGQVIAKIDDGGMYQQLNQLQERAKLSRITYQKRKKLWDQKIGSEIDYLASETQYLADQEAVKQMQAQVAKASVKAPFSGVIDETIADEGQLVTPGQTPLFRIVNLSDMYIQADVPEQYLSSVKVGKQVLVDLPVLDTTVKTKVKKVSNYINPTNRTFRVEIDVPNKDGLIKPNLTARLKINDYQSGAAVLIPQSIISENSDGEQYVYRANKNGREKYATVEKVFIKVGLKEGRYIEVLEGLEQGDFVIEEGARIVKDQQEVEITK